MRLDRHRPDFIILIVTLILVSIGLINVYSASIIWSYQNLGNSPSFFFKRQCIWSGLGLVVMFASMNIPFWFWKRLAKPLLLGSFAMLPLVFFFTPVNGARRWIDLGPLSIQPSELAIFAVIVYLSYLLTKKQDILDDFKKGVLPSVVIASICGSLVLIEPDMGTAVLLVVSAYGVMFSSGIPFRHLTKLLIGAVILSIVFIVLESYRMERMLAFLNPWKYQDDQSYQLINSLYAISSGGWTGRGLGQSIEKFLYLPEPHTDFIFAILTEEWGIIGAVTVIALFAILVWRGTIIAARIPDRFGSLLACGITTMIGFSVIVNIGMVTGIMPVIGIPLPFISYGGSSLLIKLISMGVLLNVSRYTVENPSRPLTIQTRHMTTNI
ncbi:putative lipid II flippase FtsW [Effusibacillus consociatus]|uniref:Probable peptidoglycan glycosyltransferase FtsW n=1 Tax=Effusibacillus consociatus TaxID=1117041 RepID=A0ABV9Q6N9_9BACL